MGALKDAALPVNLVDDPLPIKLMLLQVVAGSYCTYGVKYDGSVCSIGEGSFGRLGHGGSDNESSMRVIGALQGNSSICMYIIV